MAEKLTAQTAAVGGDVTDDDLLYLVNDPSGTPASRKITVATLMQAAAVRELLLDYLGDTVWQSGGGITVTHSDGGNTLTLGATGVLEDLNTLGASTTDGEFLVATGAGTLAWESGATARTSIGLGSVEDTALSTWAGTSNITTVGEAAVTAHEAALSITESQISDFGTYGTAAAVALNTTHRTSDGSDHTFIDQSVVSGASPTLDGTNITGVPAASILAGTFGTGAYKVSSGSSGASAIATGDELVVEGSGATGVSILSPDGSNAALFFGSVSDNNYAWLQGYYNSGSPFLRVRVGETAIPILAAETTATFYGGPTITSTTVTATTLAGTLSTATQNSVTTMTGLVTTGALNSGSITSGFGAIDIGGSALTAGAGTFSGRVRVTGSYDASTGSLAVTGGSGLYVTGVAGTTYDIALATAGGTVGLGVDTSTGSVTIPVGLSATLTTAAQPNVTSLGTLTSLDVSGNITNTSAGSVVFNDNVQILGTLDIAGTSIFDSTGTLTLNDNVHVGAVLTVLTNIAIASDLTLASGSITSASGAISFGNENLSTTGFSEAGIARMATWVSGGYAWFGNQAVNTATGYALLQNGSGQTLLNAASGQSLYVRVGNVNQLVLDGTTADFQAIPITTTGAISGGAGSSFGLAGTEGTLHILTASAGAVTANASGDDLVVEGSSAPGISILSPDADAGRLIFGSPTDNLGAQVYWNYSGSLFTVGTHKVGATNVLKADNNITNLTLSGASGSELATFAGDVTLSAGALAVGGTNVTVTNAAGPLVMVTDTTNTVSTYIQSGNLFGIAGTTTNHPFYLRSNGTDAAVIDIAQNFLLGATSTSSNAQFYATKTYSGTTAFDNGVKFAFDQDTATTGALYGIRQIAEATHTTGTVDDILGLYVTARGAGAGGTTTTAAGLWVDGGATNASATVTNWYGVYINGATATGTITNRWGIYQNGASENNYLAGNLGLGTTTVTDILNLGTATEALAVVDAGSTSATEQDWIEVKVGGNTGYIRVFATK